VLWLNETQRHLYGVQGERAAKLLRDALAATNGAVAVGALWSRPYLEELTARGNSPDLNAAARALLDGHRTRRITVPDCLTSQQQLELDTLARDDERLQMALAAGGADGDVIQHLTGGPELLHAYTSGGLFNRVEHALITAALDARRLGHQGAIPVTLLATAADGYLSPRQRPGHPNWATLAVTALTTGKRRDGTRTGIRNALSALKAVRVRSGDVETGYEPDDYIDQHTRPLRYACLGTRQLWDALAEHTSNPDDLNALGNAASNRGLYRHAALLWKHAVSATGNAEAASRLIDLLHTVNPDSAHRATSWVAGHAILDDPRDVAGLAGALRAAGEDLAVTTLATRAVPVVPLDDPGDVAGLVGVLRAAGDDQAVTTLVTRAVPAVSLDEPWAVGWLVEVLREAGEDLAVTTLATRAANAVSLDHPGAVADLVGVLREAGEDLAVSMLATRAASAVSLDHLNQSSDIAGLVKVLREAGEDQAVSTLATRAADTAPLDDPWAVGWLLMALHKAGEDQAVSTLATRAASTAPLDHPAPVGWLMELLHEAGQDQALTTLVTRAVPAVPLDELSAVAELVKALREVGEDQAVTTLVTRVVPIVPLDHPGAVAGLVRVLHEASEDKAVTRLATRAAERVRFDDPAPVAELLKALHDAGEDQAVTRLATRAAERVCLDDPRALARLLETLHEAGEDQAVTTLLARRPAEHVNLNNPGALAELLKALQEAGEDDAFTMLATCAAHDVVLVHHTLEDNLLEAIFGTREEDQATIALVMQIAPGIHRALPRLVKMLREAGEDQAVTTLATRAADCGLWHWSLQILPDMTRQYAFGREPDGAPSAPWDWRDLIDHDREAPT
jgi:hypothetical protein